MNSYNKQALDTIAKEQGFIRDNLEKVMRLVDVLNYFHGSKLLSETLTLKGGTAINLTVFELPRLSVDIDLDFSVNCSREEMLATRQEVNNEVLRYMQSEGYRLAPSSRARLRSTRGYSTTQMLPVTMTASRLKSIIPTAAIYSRQWTQRSLYLS